MKNHVKTYFSSLLLITAISLLTACFSDDDDTVHKASVIPAVNPGFDEINSVTKSTTPAGTFEDVTYTYDATTEKITLAENAIAAGGNYLKISGKATVGGMQDTYTVMTFVKDNNESIAANELTTLAVAMVENDADISTFDAAVDELVESTGLSEDDIKMPMTEHERSSLPNLQAALSALASNFKNSDITLANLASVSAPNMDMIAWGALLYDNWMTAPAEMPTTSPGTDPHAGHHKVGARAEEGHHGTSTGPDLEPEGLSVMLMAGTEHKHLLDSDDAEHTGFRRFARCKECHGWDQMGDEGSHKVRNRGQTTLTNPDDATDTGDFIRRPLSVNGTDLTDNTAAYTMANIVKANNNFYANVDHASPIMAGTAAAAATQWNAKVNEEDGNGVRMSDMHPDFTRTTAADAANSTTPNAGAVNDLVPSHDQIMALTAFLNYDGGKPDHVMTFSNTTESYTLKTMHDMTEAEMATAGEEYYANYCFRCHGAPNTTMSNPLHDDYENLMGFLSNDDGTLNPVRFSAVFHVARWGKSGAAMTRDRIGYPTAHTVANVLAYLKAYQADDATFTVSTAKGNVGAGDAEAGEAFYYAKCAFCHSASAHELTASDSTDTDGAGEDKTYRCHNHDTDSIVDVGVDGTCGNDTHIMPLPNLAHSNTHYKITANLKSISSAMENVNGGNPLTQQEINNLAAFLGGISAAHTHEE